MKPEEKAVKAIEEKRKMRHARWSPFRIEAFPVSAPEDRYPDPEAPRLRVLAMKAISRLSNQLGFDIDAKNPDWAAIRDAGVTWSIIRTLRQVGETTLRELQKHAEFYGVELKR